MARKSLRPQLNQIRAWVRQGRTDAWIAHQLEVSTSQLRDFRSQHGLDAEGEDTTSSESDLRDEIEAEIEAAEQEEGQRPDSDSDAADEGEEEEKPARRRRRRRGGRGRGRRRRPGAGMDATFEHGGKNGYGLRLDDSIKDDPIYAEHWADRTELKVTVEPNRIVLEPVADDDAAKSAEKRSEDPEGSDESA
jgi:hypothetical protein